MSKKEPQRAQSQQDSHQEADQAGAHLAEPADERLRPAKRRAGAEPARARRPRFRPGEPSAEHAGLDEDQAGSASDEASSPGSSPERARVGEPSGSGATNTCAACARPIRERYLLVALDKQWHEDCLKCACCDCRLGEVGSSLFTHSDKILCRRDFLRLFGEPGNCAACKRSIPPYELVMRANDLAYHMDCFACQQCQYRFCVGDRFHLTRTHRVVCVLCHGEQQARAPPAAPAEPPEVGPRAHPLKAQRQACAL